MTKNTKNFDPISDAFLDVTSKVIMFLTKRNNGSTLIAQVQEVPSSMLIREGIKKSSSFLIQSA